MGVKEAEERQNLSDHGFLACKGKWYVSHVQIEQRMRREVSYWPNCFGLVSIVVSNDVMGMKKFEVAEEFLSNRDFEIEWHQNTSSIHLIEVFLRFLREECLISPFELQVASLWTALLNRWRCLQEITCSLQDDHSFPFFHYDRGRYLSQSQAFWLMLANGRSLDWTWVVEYEEIKWHETYFLSRLSSTPQLSHLHTQFQHCLPLPRCLQVSISIHRPTVLSSF